MKKEVKAASTCGSFLGKHIHLIGKTYIDLDWSKKKQNNVLTTSRPIYQYQIQTVPVSAVEVITTANNTKAIQFNHDRDLSISLANLKDIMETIPRPTSESVKKALDLFENTGEKTIFIDREALNKEINALNRESIRAINSLANELMQQSQAITEIIEATDIATKKIASDENEDTI